MKRLKLVLIITICFFSLSASKVAASNRIALVIGNSDYQSSPLNNPANDATDIASNLELCGFEVIKRINASQRDMEKAVDTFYKKLKKADVGLFYYAGHGIQVDGRNYLIPVDAQVTSESDVKFESVDVGRVLGKMKDAGNDLNIVILDACRDNPFKRSFRSNSQGFAKMEAPRGSIIIYSTAPGSIAADGQGRNGLYTGYFLDNMMKNGFPVEKVLKETRKQVFKKTNGRQVPWDSSSLMGDFYFNQSKTTTSSVSASSDLSSNLKTEQQKIEQARRKLEELETKIAAKKRIEEKYKKVETKKETSLYSTAKQLLDDGDREKARILFEKFIKIDSNSDKADDSRFWIADIYYADKWYEKAILEYQKVLEYYPMSNYMAAARLKQGFAFAELREKANARLILKELIRKHPGSDEAKIAREKLKSL